MATVAVIAGDGIGLEVVPAAIRCIDAAVARYAPAIEWRYCEWGSEWFLRTGRMMPEDGLAQLSSADAIFLGAVGHPDIPDVETLWGLLIPIRRGFGQYVNLRPVRSFPGVSSPLASGETIDMVIVRENSEGEYSELGGRFASGTPEEFAIQDNIFSRVGIDRIAEYAFTIAEHRRGNVTSATKSNGIIHTMPFWDEVVRSVADRHPGVELRSVLIDALAAKFVERPSSFDVVVASNLFGDILSDLAGALAGSIGIAPSANLDPTRVHPSMFEPVHGSAPDIAGMGIANPIGQIWSGSMMLSHLGMNAAANDLRIAFEASILAGVVTRDLGGAAGTSEVADDIVARLR
jgi:tartrate dehydrogenase/decarboxylase/D-malate dehydrogenase